MTAKLTPDQQVMLDTWQAHGHAEFVLKDPDAAIATMGDDPYILALPLGQRFVGRKAVHSFYKYDFLPHIPPDFQFIPINRCLTDNLIADEFVVRFTHSIEMPWQIPGVPPTGRRVELAMVVFAGFKDGKLAYEHLIWDHASQLAQIGVIDQPAGRLGMNGATDLQEMWRLRHR